MQTTEAIKIDSHMQTTEVDKMDRLIQTEVEMKEVKEVKN